MISRVLLKTINYSRKYRERDPFVMAMIRV